MKLNRFRVYQILTFCVLSITAYFMANSYVKIMTEESENKLIEFQEAASRAEAAIQVSISSKLEYLYTKRDAFRVKGHQVNRQEFNSLAQSVLSRTQGIQALEWIPRVNRDSRRQYEQNARNDGFTDFEIRESDGKGNMVRAEDRDEYYPVYYVAPLLGNEKALGFDLASNSVRKEALKKALKTNTLVTSSRIKLVQEANQQNAVLVFFPQQAKEQVDEYLLLAVFRVEDLVSSIFPKGYIPDLEIYIYDTHDKKDLSPLAVLSPLLEVDKTATQDQLNRQGHYSEFRDVMVGDRTWRVLIKPINPIAIFDDEGGVWFVAFLIIIILSTIFSYLISKIKRVKDTKLSNLKFNNLNQKLNTILDNTLDGIVTIDHSGTVLSFNQSAQVIFGYTEKEVISKKINTLIPERLIEDNYNLLSSETSNSKESISGVYHDIEGIKKDGATIPLRLGISEAELKGERFYIGIFQDITERKRNEELKDSFISTVNHELRTPLTSILGSVELINKLYFDQLPEQAQPLLKIAESNTRRIIKIVNDILDIQKMEAGEMEINFTSFDINTVIEKSIEGIKVYAEKYKSNVILNEIPEKIIVSGDSDRLIQVMTNLLSNALKFSPEGESVTVMAEINKAGNTVRVNVSDKGDGIPDDFKSKIFERFSQADNSMTRKGTGTGLGLSISKAIIEKHSGEIGIDSKKGRGATFYFTLQIQK